ncbi:MAG: lamin tail domain-containing protein [Planctomycetes bacterium]|nr:lamin tail domain-containing protein [Planctomycetota bacterium]
MSNNAKVLILYVFLVLLYLSSISFSATYPLGDLDYDATIDFDDLAFLAEQWLNPGCSEQGLISRWQFDENAGITAYDSAGINDSIINDATWTSGKIGSALNFDGSNDYVDIPDFDLTGNWTISFWIKCMSLSSEATIMLMGDHDDADNFFYMIDGVRARFENSSGTNVSWETDTDFYNKWRFVTLVATTTTVELYLDGISQGAQSITPTFKLYRIGTGYSTRSKDFKGLIDDFRLFDQALTPQQISLLARINSAFFGCADVDGSGIIDMIDFSLMANNWQKTFGPVVINEVMSDNDKLVFDDIGADPDWIELYNPTDESVNVAGMYLSDSSVTWQIPSTCPALTTIDAHGYLLIWADDTPTNGCLHTNFAISSSGEDLTLIDTDGTTVLDSISVPALETNVSFGRFPDMSDNWSLFDAPTAGGTNGVGFTAIVEKPRIITDGGVFTNARQIELVNQAPGAVVHYTINGSIPTQLSDVYTGPVTINNTTRFRARAYVDGMIPSDIAGECFIEINPSIANFNSNLPIVIIATFGTSIRPPGDDYDFIYAASIFIDTNDTGRATITDGPDYCGNAGIQRRGQTSDAFAKKQYKFETWDEANQDKDVSLLNFPKESDWIFYGPESDRTLMRNYLTYKWSNDIGQYAVKTRFVEVFVNSNGNVGDSSLDYKGVYVFMQKIKRGDEAVDVTKLERGDNTEPEVTGGYIIKTDKGDVDFWTSRYGVNITYVYPDTDIITADQKNYVMDYLSDFESTLNSSGFDDPVNGYAKYVDIDAFVDHYIIAEWSENVDALVMSTYMYKDRGSKLKMGPVWDFNFALGNGKGGVDGYQWYPLEHQRFYEARWWGRLRQDPEFMLKYGDRWFKLRKGVFSTANICADIDETAAFLDEAKTRNFTRWNILGASGWAFLYDSYLYPTYAHEIQYFKDWATDRFNWLDYELQRECSLRPPTPDKDSGSVNAGETVQIQSAPSLVENLIFNNSVNPIWKYIDNGSNQGTAWREFSFDDSTWKEGTGEFGFGNLTQTTLISYGGASHSQDKYITTYFRKKFTISDPAAVKLIFAPYVRDCGFVMYLNGQEIRRTLMPTTDSLYCVPATYTTLSIEEMTGDDESMWNDFFIDPTLLVAGENIITVETHLSSITDIDLSFNMKLYTYTENPSAPATIYYTTNGTDPRLHGGGISPSASVYTSPIAINSTVAIKARAKYSDGKWSCLMDETYTLGSAIDDLRITEIMYHPADHNNPDDPNTEFIELQNIGSSPIGLNLVHFTDGIDFTFGDTTLAAGDYVLVVRDIAAFLAKYGSGYPIAGQYTGALDNGGEEIVLRDALGNEVHDFDYKDGWYDITDGEGFSLVIRDPYNADINSWDEKDSWRASAAVEGSPGEEDIYNLPMPGSIMINEVMTNPVTGQSDWIELYNTTGAAINIAGWFLSDSDNGDVNSTKYEIAQGVAIPAYGYVTFYEGTSFGNILASGCNIPFGLSSKGDQVYLRSGENGVITGYYEAEDFNAAATGVTFGRYEKSTATFNFVAMSSPTPNAENSYPVVGPIVINEIMYNPPQGADAEYIELYNTSSSPIALQSYDSDLYINVGWVFSDGISYTFPLGTIIPAHGYVVIARVPSFFTATYGSLPAEVALLGPYDLKLDNGGERLQLSIPVGSDPDYLQIDRVTYTDDPPWPTSPDGSGHSLSRIYEDAYGNDPNNWQGQTPTPGSAN